MVLKAEYYQMVQSLQFNNMATLSFEEFVKKAQGTPKDVQVLSPERKAIIEQRTGESEFATAEAARISSPFGQLKEFGKEVGEITGFTPTGRRIAAAIAPYTESEEDFANMVEELVGGVAKERKMGTLGKTLQELGASKNLAEGIDIAADLPLISLGLSKNIAKVLSEQAGKSSVETLKLLDKPLLEFLPDKVRAALKTDITTPVKETFQRGIEGGKQLVDIGVEKGKQLITPPKTKEQALGQISQGKAEDIKPLELALGTMDTSGVKTFKDLQGKIDETIPTLARQVDDELGKDTGIYKPRDLVIKGKTQGGKEVSTDYIGRALSNLSEVYRTIGDKVSEGNIKELITKANVVGLTRKEVNDISRQYGIEFSSKAFSKIGDPLTSVNAQAFENTRKGLKLVARQGLGGAEAKITDSKLSALYDTKKLIDKNVEAVNKLQQRINERGLVEKVGHFVAKYLDLVTGGSIRGFVGGLLPRGAGYKVMNALDIETALRKNLDIVEEALKKKTDEELIKFLESQ